MITISGVLYNSYSERLKFCEVFFQAIDNTGNVLNSSNKSFRTDGNGYYSTNLLEGTYRVYIRNMDTRAYWLIKDGLVVDETTTNQTLNDLLI